jgi:molybdopterin-guanine dinucleotide biosynthesis protein A
MYNDISAIILSGGKSSRMGTNKSLIELKGKTIIETLYDKLKNLFNSIILVTNEPDDYQFLNIPKFKDIYLNKGPLGGIHSGLLNSNTNRNFIISCDIPLITEDAISFIINMSENSELTLPLANGYVQELCGVYSKSLLPAIEEKLNLSNEEEIRHKDQKHRACKVHSFIKENNPKIIEFEKEYPKYNENLFFNLNSKEDLDVLNSLI